MNLGFALLLRGDFAQGWAGPEWRERLGRDTLNVGIAWSGKPTCVNDRNRSMPRATFQQLAAVGCRFFTRQPQLRAGDREALALWPEAQDSGRGLRRCADTAPSDGAQGGKQR